jgi:hypothetical protein
MKIDTDMFRSREFGEINRALQSLPQKFPGPEFRTRLLVLASQERQRRLSRLTLASRIRLIRNRFELLCEELVRPLALPLAGGLFSTIALFSMFVVPAYPRLSQAVSVADVPTILTTQVALKGVSPFSAAGDDVVVDVTVDGQGRMIDYAVVTGAAVLASSDVRRRLEQALLFTEFTPATSFGQPTPAKMRLWFRSSHIDVRG